MLFTCDSSKCDCNFALDIYAMSFLYAEKWLEQASKEGKCIVYYSALVLLLQHCASCAACQCVNMVKWRGTSLRVMQSCTSCDYKSMWQSQPMLGRQPAGNRHLSASILFVGGSSAQFFHALNTFSCAHPTHHQTYILLAPSKASTSYYNFRMETTSGRNIEHHQGKGCTPELGSWWACW